MTAAHPRWQITGEYFENCSCDVVCPCLFSTGAPLTAQPTQGACEVPFVFHIDQGRYGEVTLDGLNAVTVLRTPGPMGEGNGSVALYLDERADERQAAALQAIFSGAAGGPMGALSPLVSTILGVKRAAITFRKEGQQRSAVIPGVLDLSVHAAASMNPDEAILVQNAHPFAMDGLALAVGGPTSTWADYGMRWDNSGKNGHYAAITWSNS